MRLVRICVCGGRTFTNKDKLFKTLDRLLPYKEHLYIIAGGAPGADTLAIDWARFHKINYHVYPADWKTHGKAAGHIRNAEMLKSGIDILYAFPGGKGTENMIKICQKKNVLVVELSP